MKRKHFITIVKMVEEKETRLKRTGSVFIAIFFSHVATENYSGYHLDLSVFKETGIIHIP